MDEGIYDMKKIIALVLISFFFLQSLPITIAFAEETNSPTIYVVKPGDSLLKIARTYGTTMESLKTTNGLQSNLLIAGQKLKVPIVVQVVSGDSMRKLSAIYHTPIQTIKATNKLTSDALYVGQKIKIVPKRLNMQEHHIIMTKEEFKEWLFHHRFNRKINKIQHHHTWAPSYKHFKGRNHFQLLKGMETYHKQNKKWKTIAQHITTFPDGKIAVSRSFNWNPEGSIGTKANNGAIMIENIGNFDRGQDRMTAAQKDTIVYITALLSLKFGLSPSIDTVTYHHWWDMKTGARVLDRGHRVKSCPGTAFFGGNTTKSAKKNFYPLVKTKMKQIKANIR
jgi:LysM repeat protein